MCVSLCVSIFKYTSAFLCCEKNTFYMIKRTSLYIYIYIHLCVCVSFCVCKCFSTEFSVILSVVFVFLSLIIFLVTSNQGFVNLFFSYSFILPNLKNPYKHVLSYLVCAKFLSTLEIFTHLLIFQWKFQIGNISWWINTSVCHTTTNLKKIESSPQKIKSRKYIFKRSIAGLNSKLSFSQTGSLTKAKKSVCPTTLPIAGERISK